MEIGIIEITGILTTLCLMYYYYLKKNFEFWKSRGIPGPEPVPLFGTVKDVFFGKVSVPEYIANEYSKYKREPMFGIFISRSPVLIINDPELIKEVLIKNFSSFSNRGNRIFEKIEPLSASLINLEVHRWKPLRGKQTSMFSTGKLKEMFNLILECASNLEKIMERTIEEDSIIDCCKLTSRFTTDVIGSCIFGIDIKALEDENNQFHNVGIKFTNVNKWRTFKMRLKQMFPSLYNLLGPIMYDHEINDFFINTIVKTMEYRKNNNIKRGDFIDLLNQLKDNSRRLNDIELTDELLTAQAFGFFSAGFDTSATTISNALYELALNQNIQDKLREEIIELLKHNNGQLDFEKIKDMKYLDQIFSETLRKYPVLSVLNRQATTSFTFSERKITIPKDTRVWIPVIGIHRDPKIYENPENFDPERFSEDNTKGRHASHYLPFGDGPRNCIGSRFGNFQVKVGIVTILKKYKVDVCDKTPIPYVVNARRFLLAPKAGIHLRFSNLKE